MRRFLPNKGRRSISRWATLLNAALAKIQPACRPIGSQSERVRIRASARIQPSRKSVVNAATTSSGSANWLKAFAIERKAGRPGDDGRSVLGRLQEMENRKDRGGEKDRERSRIAAEENAENQSAEERLFDEWNDHGGERATDQRCQARWTGAANKRRATSSSAAEQEKGNGCHGKAGARITERMFVRD